MANHCQLQLADSLYWCCQDLLFIFPINLRCFTAYLKTGKHIGSNLELFLNSVVKSAKPNLDLNQQSSFEILVWNNSKAFLDVSSLWEKKRRKSHFNDLLLLSHFSRVRLSATPWTAAYQASPSMGFSRQEHWSGLPFPSPILMI